MPFSFPHPVVGTADGNQSQLTINIPTVMEITMAKFFTTTLASLLMLTTAASADPALLKGLDDRQQHLADTAKQLWDYAELGYKEHNSSALLRRQLQEQGFQINRAVADIPTAFTASYGSSGPVIAILAEFDALPGINQGVATKPEGIDGKQSGQACGHNLFGAASVEAAIAVKNWLQRTGQPGTVRLYGTPAEEGGSGKVYMARAGLFNDVDFVLHWHPSSENSAKAASTLANRSAKFRFRGISAHAAAAPENARSALDGVEAMNNMVNMLREHVPQQSRIHYVITSGGSAPNVVPDYAEVFYYLRHPSASVLEQLWPRLENAARGAAIGTGTEVSWEIIHGNHPVLVNETLARIADEKLRSLGGITYSAEEQAFAEQIHATLHNPTLPLGSEKSVQPFAVSTSYGSTDVGDVSMLVPTVGLRTATWVAGTSAHSWQAISASGMSIGFKGASLAAKTMSLIALELYRNSELRKAANAEFLQRRGENFSYRPLLGDRKPPLNYRD